MVVIDFDYKVLKELDKPHIIDGDKVLVFDTNEELGEYIEENSGE